MTVLHYAQRLLNPFRGTMHTLRHAAAEATTLDGVQWDIYVANEQLLEGLEPRHDTQISDIRYGRWSSGDGLKRGAIYPSADFLRMEAMGATVYEYLRCHYQAVPFALNDVFELWLLDATGAPMALIDSALTAPLPGRNQPTAWRPGMAAQAQLGDTADALAQCVNDHARAARWFQRHPDGSGMPLNRPDDVPLPATAFPSLLLSAPGAAGAQQLLENFLAWQSPYLLTLPLDSATRRHLERQACQQPEVVYSLHRLYPEIGDSACINAALVAAMLSRSQPPARAPEDSGLPTYYIELNPTTGN